MSNTSRWKTRLHLMPPTGWMNDPNGLCQFRGSYHVFFQYRPENAFGTGRTGWGHYTSPDLIHWTFRGMALEPDQPFDRNGAYSGSALITGDTMRLYYTGNVKFPGDYDYTYAGRGANVILTESRDGITFGKKELLLSNADYPAACTCHVRDPKVWQDGDLCYMALGARLKGDSPHTDQGGVLLYHSADFRHWDYCNTLMLDRPFGYMWECPDLFSIGTTRLLSVCPQGLPREDGRFQNIYQAGYFTVNGDITGDCTLTDFKEWDMGFDFYAPQTFLDEAGRRILIGWMGLPDIGEEYENPTTEDGWQHVLTLPREVWVNEAGAVCQRPVEELSSLRGQSYPLSDGQTLTLPVPLDILIDTGESEDTVLTLYDELVIRYSPADRTCSILFSDSPDGKTPAHPNAGFGRTVRRATAPAPCHHIRVLCDTSAVEVYFGDGETVMSTRIYPADDSKAAVALCGGSGTIWEMRGAKFLCC